MARPAFYLNASHPGSDLAGETAAALAAGAMAFKTKGLLIHYVDTFYNLKSNNKNVHVYAM